MASACINLLITVKLAASCPPRWIGKPPQPSLSAPFRAWSCSLCWRAMWRACAAMHPGYLKFIVAVLGVLYEKAAITKTGSDAVAGDRATVGTVSLCRPALWPVGADSSNANNGRVTHCHARLVWYWHRGGTLHL